MKKILVCYDFSNYSEKALEVAVHWAKKVGGVVHLAHVDDQLVYAGAYADVYTPGFEENAKKFRRDLFNEKVATVESNFKREGVEIQNHLLFGEPVQELLDFAKNQACDMIIMGSKGENFFSSLFLGSKAWKLMTKTHLPLLAVKKDMALDIKKVLYAAELSKNETRTLESLKYINDLFNPHFEIGHIVAPDTRLASNEEIDANEKYERLKEKMELAHQRALYKVNDLIKKWNLTDASTFVEETIHESVGKCLLKKVDKYDPDLLVLGSHGKSFWDRIVMGSTSEYVIRRSERSFFIIPNENKDKDA